eukprot:scaffold44889_cov23-Tisochrysis_lutea.AAC.1
MNLSKEGMRRSHELGAGAQSLYNQAKNNRQQLVTASLSVFHLHPPYFPAMDQIPLSRLRPDFQQ